MNYLNKKHLLMAALAGGTVVVASGVAVYVDNQAVAAVIGEGAGSDGTGLGIWATPHNLSSSGFWTNHADSTIATGADTQICVFCHTPHGADLETDAPLWNRNVDPNREYATYSSLGRASFDGRNSLAGSIGVNGTIGGSVSLACLSCHDGVQAMNAVINSPGPGTSDPLNADPLTDPAAMTGFTGGVWVGTTNLTDDGNPYGYRADGGGGSGLFSALGTDLRNDHPIGMQYAGGFTGTDLADQDFVTPTADGDYWYIDVPASANPTGTVGSRDKGDMQLYSRADTGAYVECASCHDPHTTATGGGRLFLRVENDNSNVCLSCHNK